MQIYESVLVIALFPVVWFGFRKDYSTHGRACLAVLAGYSSVRFLIEFFRADNSIVIWLMTFTQLICLLILVLTAFLWAATSKRGMEVSK